MRHTCHLFVLLLAAVLTPLGGTAPAAPAAGEAAVTENERMLKVDLMVVTAHPDDEGMVAATLARHALDGGRRVTLVSITRGEGGGNGTGKEYGPSLGIVREAELRACLGVLGVGSLHFLDQPDFGYTESAAATLKRWGHRGSLRRLVRLVRARRPEVIVTMDPAPRGGQHGHHQVAGRLATEAFSVAADPHAFPELSRDEGLRPWRVRKLYYSTWGGGQEGTLPLLRLATDGVSAARGESYARIARRALSHHHSQGFGRFMDGPGRPARPEQFLLVKARTSLLPEAETDLFDGCEDSAVAVTELRVIPERPVVQHDRPFRVSVRLTNLDVRPLRDAHVSLTPGAAAAEAAAGWKLRPLEPAHRATVGPGESWTVRFEVSPVRFSPGAVMRLVAEASWRPNAAESPGAGNDESGAPERLLRRAWTHVRAAPRVEVAFRPSAQLQEYRRWARRQGLEWLVGRLSARAPLTIGSATAITLEVTNHTPTVAAGAFRVVAPPGWVVSPALVRYAVPSRATAIRQVEVTLPASIGQTDADLQAVATDGTTLDTARAEALPRLVARRLSSPLPVDADPGKWRRGAGGEGAIPATAIVSGQISGPSEASARFWVGYDTAALQVLVDVTDDTVVTNIAPDDIRGHWRTTSVEICVDPRPRAENTFQTLKLGIFPADLTGRVRAARDADANPGPVDRVDPGIRLASRLTSTGYVVEARIPWSSLPGGRNSARFRPTPGQRLGFNVILYHAGKKDAGVGEDVGKARLAWAHRPGVWGRPASWGTLVLR